MKSFTENSITLNWDQPEDDGGCLITQYIVEHREGTKRSWQRDGTCKEEEYTSIALTEGQNYTFHVAAENEVVERFVGTHREFEAHAFADRKVVALLPRRIE